MSCWSLVVGAGAKSVESNGKEEATGTVPDGAQVSGEEAEERVHPVTLSCQVRVAMCVQRWTDYAGNSSEIRLRTRIDSHHALDACFVC